MPGRAHPRLRNWSGKFTAREPLRRRVAQAIPVHHNQSAPNSITSQRQARSSMRNTGDRRRRCGPRPRAKGRCRGRCERVREGACRGQGYLRGPIRADRSGAKRPARRGRFNTPLRYRSDRPSPPRAAEFRQQLLRRRGAACEAIVQHVKIARLIWPAHVEALAARKPARESLRTSVAISNTVRPCTLAARPAWARHREVFAAPRRSSL